MHLQKVIVFAVIFILSKVISYSVRRDCESSILIIPEVCGVKVVRAGKAFARIPDYVIFSHTAERPCHNLLDCCRIISEIRRYHINELGWTDIGYNFLIGNDGWVYVGRAWRTVGQFSLRYNERSLGIAFIGNYFGQIPSGKSLEVAKRFLDCAVNREHLARNYTIHMHEDVECTRIPAPALRQNLTTWVRYQRRAYDYVPCRVQFICNISTIPVMITIYIPVMITILDLPLGRYTL